MESEDKKPIFTKRVILIILAIILLVLIIFLLLRRCGNDGGNYKVAEISLTPTRINVRVGEQQQVYANVLPSDAKDSSVYWTVEDPSIASVDQNGVITGIKDGVTIITATANDGSGVTGTATITVGDELPALEQVQLDRSTYTIGVGKTIMISLTPVPATASLSDVQFSISDTSIATVDGTGKIKGIKVGSTILTVTANNGTVTAKATVKVVNNSSGNNGNSGNNSGTTKVPVTTIKLKATEACYQLKVGSTYKVDVEILPSNATDKTLKWEVVSGEDPSNATKNKEAKNYASVSSTGVVTAKKDSNKQKIGIKMTAKSGAIAYFYVKIVNSGTEGYCNLNSGDNTGGNTGGNSGGNTGTTVKTPNIDFICNGSKYSSSCDSNVTALASGGTQGVDYDKIYYCLQTGAGICTPTSSAKPIISYNGRFTLCATYEKNGKMSKANCNTKDIVIKRKEETNPTATITFDKTNKKFKVTAPIGSVVTITCTNFSYCPAKYTMASKEMSRNYTDPKNSSEKASIVVTVTYNGKQIGTNTLNIAAASAPKLSCSMSLSTSTSNGKDIYKVVANVTGGTGTLTGKGDGTYSEDVKNTKFSKEVTSGRKYTFTAKDTSGTQADCSITLADQYQIVEITQKKSPGEIVETKNCTSGDSVICTDIYYIMYNEITYSNYQQTKLEYKDGNCVASDDTSAKEGKYKEITKCGIGTVCKAHNVTAPCKIIYTFTGTAKSTPKNYSSSYYFQASLTSAMQSCNMTYSKCYTEKKALKQTVTRTTSQGNWLSYRESCPLDKRCYWKHQLIKSN